LVAQLHGVNVVPLIQMILIHVHLPFLYPSLQQVRDLQIEPLGKSL
jgi:DNA-binding protein Fis